LARRNRGLPDERVRGRAVQHDADHFIRDGLDAAVDALVEAGCLGIEQRALPIDLLEEEVIKLVEHVALGEYGAVARTASQIHGRAGLPEPVVPEFVEQTLRIEPSGQQCGRRMPLTAAAPFR
jgi:hypothetical protein